MIRNIIFDMGNVLLDYNPDVSLQKYCCCEESREIIKRELFLGEEWRQGDLGYITNSERYELVKHRVPEQYHKELKQVVEHWHICMVPLPGAREFVNRVKEEGYRLYVLSNACAEFYHYFPKQFALSVFDGVVVSSDLHIVKPDQRIYCYLLDTYCLEAKESIFIDDMPANVDAAEKLGMHGLVFHGCFEDAEDYLRQF